MSAPPAAAALRYPRTDERILDLDTDPFGPNSPMYRAFLGERVVWNCYEPLQVKPVADPGQPVVYPARGAVIHRVSFTPNAVGFSVTADVEGARVYLNENAATGWRSDAGPVLVDANSGRAYVAINPSRPGTYWFRFVPPGLRTGAVLLVAGLALSFLVRNRNLP